MEFKSLKVRTVLGEMVKLDDVFSLANKENSMPSDFFSFAPVPWKEKPANGVDLTSAGTLSSDSGVLASEEFAVKEKLPNRFLPSVAGFATELVMPNAGLEKTEDVTGVAEVTEVGASVFWPLVLAGTLAVMVVNFGGEKVKGAVVVRRVVTDGDDDGSEKENVGLLVVVVVVDGVDTAELVEVNEKPKFEAVAVVVIGTPNLIPVDGVAAEGVLLVAGVDPKVNPEMVGALEVRLGVD